LKRLIDLTQIEVDLSELENASEYFEQQVNHLVEHDPKLQEIISKLEEVYKGQKKFPKHRKRRRGSKRIRWSISRPS
jgi:predicted ribosome quality control (RQC) complex YloA/Tae2 family protein